MPLSIAIPTADVLVGIPLVADKSWAICEFKGVDEKPNEKGMVLTFRWEIVEPAPSNQGKPIQPGALGSKVFDTVRLYDKNTPQGQFPEQSRAKIGLRQDACLGTGDPDNAKGKPPRPNFDDACVSAMLGKRAALKFKIDTFEGNTKNDVTEVMHIDDYLRRVGGHVGG